MQSVKLASARISGLDADIDDGDTSAVHHLDRLAVDGFEVIGGMHRAETHRPLGAAKRGQIEPIDR